MARFGQTAALPLTFTGRLALDPLAEVDLDIAASGIDPLEIDPPTLDGGPDPLIVTAAVLWTGRTASETA